MKNLARWIYTGGPSKGCEVRIEYSYKAGMAWATVRWEVALLIVSGAAALPSINRPGVVVVGEPPADCWRSDYGNVIWRPGLEGGLVGFELMEWTGAAVEGIYARPMAGAGASMLGNDLPVNALVAGQNSAAGGNVSADGQIRIAVNEFAIAFSFNYAGARELALIGEADGDFFGAAQYPRGFVMSSKAVASGAGLDAVARVPYFERVKNHAAAGDKVGLSGSGIAFAAGPAATNGYVTGLNEAAIYQALPLEIWSNPKAAHLGFVRGVMLAPCKNVSNDDFLAVGGVDYIVFRENQAAAVAVAMKA